MDLEAPIPQHNDKSVEKKKATAPAVVEETNVYDPENPSIVKVTIAGCGGKFVA